MCLSSSIIIPFTATHRCSQVVGIEAFCKCDPSKDINRWGGRAPGRQLAAGARTGGKNDPLMGTRDPPFTKKRGRVAVHPVSMRAHQRNGTRYSNGYGYAGIMAYPGSTSMGAGVPAGVPAGAGVRDESNPNHVPQNYEVIGVNGSNEGNVLHDMKKQKTSATTVTLPSTTSPTATTPAAATTTAATAAPPTFEIQAETVSPPVAGAGEGPAGDGAAKTTESGGGGSAGGTTDEEGMEGGGVGNGNVEMAAAASSTDCMVGEREE